MAKALVLWDDELDFGIEHDILEVTTTESDRVLRLEHMVESMLSEIQLKSDHPRKFTRPDFAEMVAAYKIRFAQLMQEKKNT